jgi:hypothetical protein
MNGQELFAFVERMAIKINEAAISMRTSTNIGFAIPIPDGVGVEAKELVDRELVKLSWSFKRTMIGTKEYYVLFPLG